MFWIVTRPEAAVMIMIRNVCRPHDCNGTHYAAIRASASAAFTVCSPGVIVFAVARRAGQSALFVAFVARHTILVLAVMIDLNELAAGASAGFRPPGIAGFHFALTPGVDVFLQLPAASAGMMLAVKLLRMPPVVLFFALSMCLVAPANRPAVLTASAVAPVVLRVVMIAKRR